MDAAVEKIRSVRDWLANEVDAGDEAVALHRDALDEALVEIEADQAELGKQLTEIEKRVGGIDETVDVLVALAPPEVRNQLREIREDG